MTRHHILAEWMPPQGGPEKAIFVILLRPNWFEKFPVAQFQLSHGQMCFDLPDSAHV